MSLSFQGKLSLALKVVAINIVACTEADSHEMWGGGGMVDPHIVIGAMKFHLVWISRHSGSRICSRHKEQHLGPVELVSYIISPLL